VVPLTSKDLLTKSKLAEITKYKKQERTKRDQFEKPALKNKKNNVSGENTESHTKKIDKRCLSSDSDSKSRENSPRTHAKTPKESDNFKERTTSEITDNKNGKQLPTKPVSKKKRTSIDKLDTFSGDGLIPLNALENAEDELMDTGVTNELKQFPLESDQLILKNNRE